jgi:hypothetical protein
MSDDTLRLTEQFKTEVDQAPADRPFSRVPHYLAEFKKIGEEESDAKQLLQSATTNEDLIRLDGHESVGTAASPKELSLFAALS